MSGACLDINCCCRYSSLVLQDVYGTDSLLYCREDETQGGSLAIVTYSIGILLMIKKLKADFTDVAQPWYAEDPVALGTFTIVESYF